MADAAFSAVGGVHVVFNNAGIAVGGPVLEMTHDDWRWTIDVDLWGPIHGVEAFLPRIVEQGEGGHVLFTASFAGLVPNSGLGPYCVAKYGVVALAEVLWRELREHRIGVSVLCPMRVGTNIGQSERNRQADYGETAPGSRVADQAAGNDDLAGRVLDVDGVAALTVDAIEQNRLYVLPHEESRESIRRRFARIDRTFDEQPTLERAVDVGEQLAELLHLGVGEPGERGDRAVRAIDAVGNLASGRRQLEDAEALVALGGAPPHEVALGELRRQHRAAAARSGRAPRRPRPALAVRAP